ncbi:unnamed protein product [Ambrosiozyma monospora]|uniref:Unnamed protein product n=1 Tax=Ambrosiozyma monospora TaxID=43982 RepID=A0ACB5TZ85_AMBMO|nr:unnamed protein product [Ambrosiozyma monospora]
MNRRSLVVGQMELGHLELVQMEFHHVSQQLSMVDHQMSQMEEHQLEYQLGNCLINHQMEVDQMDEGHHEEPRMELDQMELDR